MVFDGNDVRITRRHGSTPYTLALFSHHFGEPNLARLWGKAFVDRYDIDALFFSAAANHWWNSPEFWPAVALAKRTVSVPIIGYGCSMGATGALLAFERVIAISPQVSIDRSIVPWEQRWPKEAAETRFIHAPAQATSNCIVVWDPEFLPDHRHVELLPEARKRPQVGAGHRLPEQMTERGEFVPLILSLISELADEAN